MHRASLPARPSAMRRSPTIACCLLAAWATAASALEPAPVVTGVSPASIPGRGGVRITIEGSNFVRAHGTCTVGVGEHGARTVAPDLVTPTQIVFTCPGRLSQSSVPIVVTAPDGQKSVTWFVDASPPIVTSLSAAGGPRSGGVLLTIQGQNFLAADTRVEFDGTIARPITLDDSTIVVSTPEHAASAASQQVVVRARGTATAPLAFAALGPRIDSVSPASIAAQGGTPITIYGENFSAAGTSLTIGGADCPVTFASPTELRAIAPPQNVKVTAVEASVAGARSNGAHVPVDATPQITGLWPGAGRASGGTSLTIIGTNFGDAPLVTVGGTPVQATQVSPSRLTCTTPPGSGIANVAVTNADGLAGTTKYGYLDPPSITSVSPQDVPAEGGAILTVIGTNFGPNDDRIARSVLVSGAPVAARWTGPGVLEARAPAGFFYGAVQVEVDGVASANSPLTYGGQSGAALPSIASLSPPTAAMGGGTTITINGTNFGAAPQAWVGSQPVATTPLGATRCAFTAPASIAGALSRAICVTTGGKSSNSVALGTASPAITSVSPSPALAGGVRLTIQGSNFGDLDRMRVRFGGGSAETPLTSASPTQLTCVAPPGTSAGAVALDVVSVDGLASPASSLTYAGPDITSLSPPTQAAYGGQTLTINGTNFGATAGSVSIGRESAVITSWTDTEIRAVAGGQTDPSPAKCRVTTATGTPSDPPLLDGAGPVLLSISPGQGQASGNTLLTIQGSNFSPGAQAVRSGVTLPVLERSPSGLVCLSPPGAAGTGNVQVLDFGLATQPQAFAYLAPPVIDHVSPASGALAGGTPITIHGQNFGTAQGLRLVVSLGDGAGIPATPVSPTECVATTDPSAVSGPVDVHLIVDATTTTAPNAFSYGGVSGVAPAAPVAFALHTGANPFSGALALRIALPAAAPWRLTLFDAAGAVVRRFDGRAEAGEFAVAWDGRRGTGARAAPGVYLAKLEAGGRTAVRRVVKID